MRLRLVDNPREKHRLAGFDLRHARERLQELITERVSEYVTSRAELVKEIEELFSG